MRDVAQLPASELREWMVYAAIEPFGGPADDVRMGLAAAVQVNRHRKAGSRPVLPQEMMPWHRREPRVLSSADLKAVFTQAARGARKRGKRTA